MLKRRRHPNININISDRKNELLDLYIYSHGQKNATFSFDVSVTFPF